MNPKVMYKSIEEIINANPVLKLHLGCGENYKDGWINIDNNLDENIKKLDYMHDLTLPLNFHKNSISFIYCEHLLEHLTFLEGQNFIKNSMNLLKSGGVFRIAMPDLVWCINMYLDDNWKEDYKDFLIKFGLYETKTKAEMLNKNFRLWGHKWLYDYEELKRSLEEIGCLNFKRCEIYKSDHPELCNLETRKESLLIVEITK